MSLLPSEVRNELERNLANKLASLKTSKHGIPSDVALAQAKSELAEMSDDELSKQSFIIDKQIYPEYFA